MKRLFIAEKPALGQIIADALGGGTKKGGFIECAGGDVVTWCIGHILELCPPESYNPAYAKWNVADLPMQLRPFRLQPSAKTKSQFDVVKSLIVQAELVVHAGDPDDEGQLLVDEVIEYCGFNGPVKRVLINDLNTAAAAKALSKLRDNNDFRGLYQKAIARSVGDFLYGMNMTRAYSLAAQANGGQGVLSVGRVQTPILGLIVNRYLAFKSHKEAFFYSIKAQLKTDRGPFKAKFVVTDDCPVDDNKRITDLNFATAIAVSTSNKPAVAKTVKLADKDVSAPLPFSLLNLQAKMSKEHGLNAAKTLEITQSLREKHRAITYNRSDCCYLSSDQFNEAPATIAALSSALPEFGALGGFINPGRKGRAFNDEKITAHTAIIPTTTQADLSRMSKDEVTVYKAIALQYLAQFMEPKRLKTVSVEIGIGSHSFSAAASAVVHPGWSAAFTSLGVSSAEDDSGADEDDGESSYDVLSVLKDGAALVSLETLVSKEKTKPLPLYTEATLLKDLQRVAKYITDPHIKKLLIERDNGKDGEQGGIGTPATRSTMLEKLKERGFYVEEKKKIVPTELGISFIQNLPEIATSPNMTALWHEQQMMIEKSEISVDDFLSALESFIDEQIKAIDMSSLTGNSWPCECGGVFKRRKSATGFFWGCSNYPTCKKTANDKNGKPDFSISEPFSCVCPKCNGEVRETPKAFNCKSCDFRVWSIIADKKLTENQVKTLLQKGKTGVIKGFKSKAGKAFDAILVLNRDSWQVNFEFQNK